MSNYDNDHDKDTARLEELRQRHKKLDILIESKYHNYTVNDEVRRLKTQKLWLKDEIHRIESIIKHRINGD